jgi:hypothetical protein
MEPHLSPEDRAHGEQIASSLPNRPATTQLATATPPRSAAATQSRPIETRPPAPPVRPAAAPPRPRPEHPIQSAERPPAPRPAAPVAASAGGRWRVQLGAYSSEANARRAWGEIAGRLGGLRPVVVHAGAVFRLQAGPLASRETASQACARAHVSCFPVGP